jgi:lipopolysaccharide/colanic/teichoic acid biosynthesis glycosyltransferase
MAAIAVAIKLTSPGSVLFAQNRVGRKGQQFRLYKFRSMVANADQLGSSVTITTDPRITRIGRLLRKAKLDELPQLWNIVKGEMSFVGPRPDVPGFADQLEGKDRIVLSVRPGLTGPATLRFRNEEELLALQADPEEYNRTVIYPEKVRLNREYVENHSFSKDIQFIFKTVTGR